MVVPAADIFDVIPASGWSPQLFSTQLDSLFVHCLATDFQSSAVPLLVSGFNLLVGNPLPRPLSTGPSGSSVDLSFVADSLSEKDFGRYAMDGRFQSFLSSSQSCSSHLDDRRSGLVAKPPDSAYQYFRHLVRYPVD